MPWEGALDRPRALVSLQGPTYESPLGPHHIVEYQKITPTPMLQHL